MMPVAVEDPTDLATIFDRYARQLLRYSARRVGPDLAEDVVAETFLQAYAHRHRYDPARAEALPWLYGIATNVIRRHRRAEVRRAGGDRADDRGAPVVRDPAFRGRRRRRAAARPGYWAGRGSAQRRRLEQSPATRYEPRCGPLCHPLAAASSGRGWTRLTGVAWLLVTEIVIKPMRYLAPVSQALVTETLADLAERYGGSGDDTPVQAVEFDPPEGGFFVAYIEEWPVGCGGWRTYDDDEQVAEIKRMYTRPEARKLGVARALLVALEESARDMGRKRIILQTGSAQPEAMALYERAGYEPIPSYGFYRDAPGARSYGRNL